MKIVLLAVVLAAAAPLSAQSVNLQRGQHGVEGTIGWSTSDINGGMETFLSVGISGVVDLGWGFIRYDETYDSGSSYDELAPFARLFVLKQQSGAPISVALYAQIYLDEYDEGDLEGDYIQIGPTFYRSFKVSDAVAIMPFIGYAFMTENMKQGGVEERTNFIQRDLGLQLATRADRPWGVSVTFIDQAYNTGTYRSARLSLLRRF